MMSQSASKIGIGENDAQMAREAGFDTIDLSDVYSGEEVQILRVAEWDFHPNAYGHRLIANRLQQELHSHPEIRERLGW